MVHNLGDGIGDYRSSRKFDAVMNEEIRELMNGINLQKTMYNAGLNQIRNTLNALDNLLTQISGMNYPFQKQIEDIREFYFQSLVMAKNILDGQKGNE